MKREALESAINLLTSMVVRKDAFENNIDRTESFRKFRKSRTYACLHDPETGLWMNGPDYIYDEYKMYG